MRTYLIVGALVLALLAVGACGPGPTEVFCVEPVTLVNEQGEEIETGMTLYRSCDETPDTVEAP